MNGLEVQHLSVAFGGLLAVDDVSLTTPLGTITGLIGPNGAGKTTTFNACSGLLRPRRGTVRVLGTDVTRRGPATRARLGLGRTFQRVEISPSLTVRDNVLVGAEARRAGINPLRQVLVPPGDRRATGVAVDAALERCSLRGIADTPARLLSTGQCRLVELARVFASGAQLLLLDEPSSGLDDAETADFGAVLTQAVTELNIGVLLVEHDMGLVMETCSRLYVLDFGRLIFEGDPAEAQASPIVRSAYLGSDAA
jgi:ABC-type branched-subunit amino acid transport system ATPase component